MSGTRKLWLRQDDSDDTLASRAGEPPLNADNTQIVSASNESSSSRETRAAQRDDVTNSMTVENVESPRPQEDSHNQSTIIRPHTVQADRTVPVQPSAEPPTPYYPALPSSSGRSAYPPHAEQFDRAASHAEPPTPYYPPLPSSNERSAYPPHADQYDRTASLQPVVASYPPPPSPSFGGASLQPIAQTSNPYITPYSSSNTNLANLSTPEIDVNKSYADILRRHAPAQTPIDPSSPPLLKQPSTFISPLSSPSAPGSANSETNLMYTPKRMLPNDPGEPSSAQGAPLELPYPPRTDIGPSRSDEQNNEDPSSAPRKPPALPSNLSPPPLSSSGMNPARPHTDLYNRAASGFPQPSAKFPTGYPPPPLPFSSSGTNAARPHTDLFNHVASGLPQPSAKFPTGYPPPFTPFSSNGKNATGPYADSVNYTASNPMQPPIRFPTPHLPPFSSGETTRPYPDSVNDMKPPVMFPTPQLPSFSSSEKNANIPPADPVNRATYGFMQPPTKFPNPNPHPLPFSSSETNATRPHVEPVDRTAPVQPPARSYNPSASPSSSHTDSDEQARNDPLAASRRPPPLTEHTPATTEPSRQDHEDPFAAPKRLPVPPGSLHTTTELPSRQGLEVNSAATPGWSPVRPVHTPAMTTSPSLQGRKDAYAALSRPPLSSVVIGHSTTEGEMVHQNNGDAIMQSQHTGGMGLEHRPSSDRKCHANVGCPCCGIICNGCDIDCVCCGTVFTYCCFIHC